MGDLVKPDAGAPPTGEELQYLSREMRDEWVAVAHELITDGELYRIQTDNQGREQEKIYQMLLFWKQKKGSKATRNDLAQTLENNGRTDLSDYILKGIKPTN